MAAMNNRKTMHRSIIKDSGWPRQGKRLKRWTGEAETTDGPNQAQTAP
jgi:hypothetical protein